MPWQSTYAEMVFLDTLWPDFTRTDIWRAIELYVNRDRRFGGASGRTQGLTLAHAADGSTAQSSIRDRRSPAAARRLRT